MDWIHLAQDKERRQSLVNPIMILRVSLNVGNFLANQAVCFSRVTATWS
jgi:hypothetical protein